MKRQPVTKSAPRLSDVRSALRAEADPEKARLLQRFFKTGKGEYGEGDRFLGVMVPTVRQTVKTYRLLPLKDALVLLRSRFHEERLTALLLLVDRYARGSSAERNRLCASYLANTRYINNWDLVDLSAPQIVGVHFLHRKRSRLYALAKSKSVWERRIAILATFMFIRNGEFADAFAIAEKLMNDPHDLIHKAIGWMLREIGKRDRRSLDAFLRAHAGRMPRTALRYAIEKHTEIERRRFLSVPRARGHRAS